MHKGLKNGIIRQIEAANRLLDRIIPRAADNILKGLSRQLKRFPSRLISKPDAQALIQVIEVIREELV